MVNMLVLVKKSFTIDEMVHYYATSANFLLHYIMAEYDKYAAPNASKHQIRHKINRLAKWNDLLVIVETSQHCLHF